MYLNNLTPTIVFRPLSKSPRPQSRKNSKSKATLQVNTQFKASPVRRPPSFLTNRHQSDVEPSIVILAPQTSNQIKTIKKDVSVKKFNLLDKTYRNKSANKYQQDTFTQNTANNRSFQKDAFLNVKDVLPPKSRKYSDANTNINQLLEKIQQKEQLIKEIRKIGEHKISDNIRKPPEEKRKNGSTINNERSKQKHSTTKIQSYNDKGLKLSSNSEPEAILNQSLKNQQTLRFNNRNPEQPKINTRQRPNYIWTPKEVKLQTSVSITDNKPKLQVQRPHSYLDLLSNQKNPKNSISTTSFLIFENNESHQAQSRKNSTQKKRLKFQTDNFNKNNKSVFSSFQLNDNKAKEPLSTKKKVSIKDFNLKKTLGEGKFGIVYQAFHIESNTLYAIKKISKQVIKSNLMVDQLLQEIKIQFYCNHENILKIYGFFDDAESVYLILEYMEEGTLFSYFKKQKTLEQRDAAIKIRQIASGIVYLQQNGIAHRDIKPQNIVLSNGVGKLCDFGWAAICTDRRKTYCGTFDYVAPEILEGNEYDQTVDLWCLGVMAYELLIGKAPFYHISRKQTMKKIMSANLEFPSHLSKNAISFIDSLIRKNPEQRLNGQDILKHPFLVENTQLHEGRRSS